MWRGNKRILFPVFSIQKITGMLSSNHNLSLYTKLMTVVNKEDIEDRSEKRQLIRIIIVFNYSGISLLGKTSDSLFLLCRFQ